MNDCDGIFYDQLLSPLSYCLVGSQPVIIYVHNLDLLRRKSTFLEKEGPQDLIIGLVPMSSFCPLSPTHLLVAKLGSALHLQPPD